jgi:hypothetical protein
VAQHFATPEEDPEPADAPNTISTKK